MSKNQVFKLEELVNDEFVEIPLSDQDYDIATLSEENRAYKEENEALETEVSELEKLIAEKDEEYNSLKEMYDYLVTQSDIYINAYQSVIKLIDILDRKY